MDAVANLFLGFSISLQPINLLFCFVGVVLGVIVGILPGLGSAATIALLLPITYFLDTATAIIMLAGIWYGSMYGGSITSILLRVPGESASVMVAIDGYELTKQGRAGVGARHVDVQRLHRRHVRTGRARPAGADAGRIRARASDRRNTLRSRSLGLTLVSYLATNSILKAIAVTVFGLLLGTVGLDPVRSTARFTFGSLTCSPASTSFRWSWDCSAFRKSSSCSSRRLVAPPRRSRCRAVCARSCRRRQDWREARRSIG